MNIKFKTKVKGNYREVMSRFDKNLFEALKPKHADMEIVEFTGSRKGDRVHLRFHMPWKTEWVSLITEHGNDENKAYFVDEGIQLPQGLSFWRHKHIVEKLTDDSSFIIDDITFKGSNFIMSTLLYPGIYLAFLPRKKVYKEYFNSITR